MMTFEEVLSKTIAMLQQHGRVTYRALKRQFNLDDDYLEDLKGEILYAYPQVTDEKGQGLAWTEADATSLDMAPSQTTGPPLSEAERRQLTVMFCDLVDSTNLSGRLDPEDLREVVRAYQRASAEVIERYEGHIAQYLGDGLLVYFGYPQAHEEDAQRAVQTGLEIVEAMGPLNTQLEQDYGIRLAVRVSIHTGLVVVGDMGGGRRQEQLALGETPNIAARLEGLAAPNGVVISASTRRLVGGMFDLQDLGARPLKGLAAPMQVYHVRGERSVESRFAAATATGLTPLVGREEELGLLLRRWEQAKASVGQAVLLCGEPGIGKSRITQTLYENLANEPHIRLLYQCSPYYTNSAFYPLIMQIERAAQFARNDTPGQKIAKLEALLASVTDQVADILPLIAALLALPTGDRDPLLALTPQRQKAKTIEALGDLLVSLARQQPVLFVFEDAHWSDPTSLEVLDLLVHRLPDLRVLMVITCRPEFVAPWSAASYMTILILSRLSRSHVAAMVERLTGDKPFPTEVFDQLFAKTDGVPLFVEELTKTLIESRLLHEAGDRYALTAPLPQLSIPATLQDALMARLDRLAAVKEVAQIGAVIGREFSYELLAAVAPVSELELEAALNQLVKAELLFHLDHPGAAHYRFKHALVRDTAYDSLLKSTRHQLHTIIATVLVEQFPAVAAAEPEVVARHYTEAGLNEPAILYWQQAGQRAVQRSANVEAVGHLTQGLQLLQARPETLERIQQELTLQVALGTPLIATKGLAAPEVERVYDRARELCVRLGETAQIFPVLIGLHVFYTARGSIQVGHDLAEQAFRLAQREQAPALLLEAHTYVGNSLYWLGQMVQARGYLEQAAALYDPQQHQSHAFLYGQDPGIVAKSELSWLLWILGYPDQALKYSEEALAMAQEIAHAHSTAFATSFAALLHGFRGEWYASQTRAEETVTLATEHGIPLWWALGMFYRGMALLKQGHLQEGLGLMQQGNTAYCETGAKLGLSWNFSVLAEACGRLNGIEEGLCTIAQAFAVAQENGESVWAAELYRLNGVLLLSRSRENHIEAETCFYHALDVAHRQQAKSWELRAAMSLSRLWQEQSKRDQAYALLAPIYNWFTEGFDTTDLQEARMLLEEIGAYLPFGQIWS